MSYSIWNTPPPHPVDDFGISTKFVISSHSRSKQFFIWEYLTRVAFQIQSFFIWGYSFIVFSPFLCFASYGMKLNMNICRSVQLEFQMMHEDISIQIPPQLELSTNKNLPKGGRGDIKWNSPMGNEKAIFGLFLFFPLNSVILSRGFHFFSEMLKCTVKRQLTINPFQSDSTPGI